MHSLLPNLVHRNSLSCGVDSVRSLFQELSGCCNMLHNSMICSKWHILGTNPVITSKLCKQGLFIMQSRLRQVSFFKKLSGCCKMLQNNMICSKYYNLETNALITFKLGTQYQIVMWSRFRQAFLQKISGCCNIQQSYYFLQITLFCSKLKIFVKAIFWNQFRMPNKPCIPSLEVIIAIFLDLYDLLQKIQFCSILHQAIIF